MIYEDACSLVETWPEIVQELAIIPAPFCMATLRCYGQTEFTSSAQMLIAGLAVLPAVWVLSEQ